MSRGWRKSGKISANKWRNPDKLNCVAWKGIGNPIPVQQLGQCLKEEIEKSKGKKRGRRMSEYVSFFVPWQEESKRREEKRKEKQNKQAKKAPTETANPPPYQPQPSAPNPFEAGQPSPPTPCPTTSKNPFTSPQNPYASARRQLNLMINKDTPTPGFPPPLSPPPLGQFPLVQMPNPNYGRPRGAAAVEGGEPPRDEEPFTYTYQPWTAEDRKHVLKDVPPLSEGHQQWRDAVELIRQNWLLNGQEMLQVLQDLLGLRFARVRGNFTGSNADGEFLRNDQLQAALNPVYDRIRTILAPRPDYAKIGETTQKENETASDFLDRLRPVFRQNSGLEHVEGPDTPYE